MLWPKTQYMTETFFGNFKAADSTEEATHVMISADDYYQIRESYKSIDAELKNTRYKLAQACKEKADTESKLRLTEKKLHQSRQTSQTVLIRHDVEVALEKEVYELKQENEQLHQRVKAAQDLNSNLKRIARERANQIRGLAPKKVHDGYLVLNSRQWTEHLADGTTGVAWKSIIQTPYDASIPLEAVKRDIYEDLVEKVLPDIGCSSANPEDQNGVYEGEKGPRMFRWSFSADYGTGLWSIDIYTTEAVSVPPYRRTAQQKSRKTTPNRIRAQKQNVMTGEETDDFVSVFGDFGV